MDNGDGCLIEGPIYLAATFSRANEMRHYRNVLGKFGLKVTSSWIDHEQEGMDQDIIRDFPDKARKEAVQDITDIMKARTFIHFTDQPSSTGGRHTEHGVALAFGKVIIIIGPRENVFQVYQGVYQFYTWDNFIGNLRRLSATH